MNRFVYTTLLLASVFVSLSGCSGTAVRGHGSVVILDEHSHVAIVFSDSDRRHIHSYYQERKRYYKGRKNLPPGLAKREHLPPGLAKREQLPPGLYGYRLPHELDRRLSRLPEGVVRVHIGTEIVLMDERTRVVLDVIKDIPLD
jgi:hypothetical protein